MCHCGADDTLIPRPRPQAHSAGGWLARVWMQQNGARTAPLLFRTPCISALTRTHPPLLSRAGCEDLEVVLSLGSPLRPPPSGIPGVFDQTRGILTYVDRECPGAAELQAAVRLRITRVVCMFVCHVTT